MAVYSGSIDLISGIRPKNNGTFPLVNAPDIQVDDTGKRLDEKLRELTGAVAGGITSVNNIAADESGNVDTIITRSSRLEFPNMGNIGCIYIATDEGSIYRWDDTDSKYYLVGETFSNKTLLIDGGNANG